MIKQLIDSSKVTLKYSIPIVISRIANASCGFASMIIVARLGLKELAAGALVTSIMTLLLILGWAVLFSINVTVGRAYGAGQYDIVAKLFRAGLFLSFLLGVFITILFWIIPNILLAFRQDPELVILCKEYLNAVSIGVIPSMMFVCIWQFLISIGKLKTIIVFSVYGLILLIFLGLAFTFGFGVIPALKMKGMGLANGLEFWILFLTGLVYVFINKDLKKLNLFSSRKISYYHLKELFLIGWPISVQLEAELLAFTIATIFMGWFGIIQLGAWQIVSQIAVLVIMIPYGIGQASSVLVARALGEENHGVIKYLGYSAIAVGIVFLTVVAFIYLCFPKLLISFYINLNDVNAFEIIKIATLLFAIDSVIEIFDGVRNVITGSLRGFHDTKVPMWVSIIANWFISLPLGYILAIYFNLGGAGIKIGFLVGFALGAFVLVRRFNKKCSVLSSS